MDYESMAKPAFTTALGCYWMILDDGLVEAAGVEPASEIAVSQESSCFVRFLLVSPPQLRTDKMRRELVR